MSKRIILMRKKEGKRKNIYNRETITEEERMSKNGEQIRMLEQ